MASPSRRRGAATLAKFTIRPERLRCMILAASRQNKNVPATFTCSTSSTLASGVVNTWFMLAIAALLIRASSAHTGREFRRTFF